MTVPRFRLRTLMIVMAVTALALGVEVTRRQAERRSAEYRARVAQWQRNVVIAVSGGIAAHYRVKAVWHPNPEDVEQLAKYTRQAQFCRAMKAKWKQAAAHPWRPVAPDPPEPK